MGCWFNRVMDEFCPLAMRFAGQPILYVEIGVWKGNSAEWVCENVLTAPGARGIGIDPYPPDRKRSADDIDNLIKKHAVDRLKRFEDTGRWWWRFEKSQDVLRSWGQGPIDFLYVDGSHLAHDVVMDFCYAWPHLRDGSLVVFDDWGIGLRKERQGLLHVPTACRAITEAFGGMVEVVNPGGMQYALIVRNKLPLGEQPDQPR